MNNMNNSDKIFVKADKTRNFYKMDYQKYNNLLTKNITKSYKKLDTSINNLEAHINQDNKRIAQRLNISDRVRYCKPEMHTFC